MNIAKITKFLGLSLLIFAGISKFVRVKFTHAETFISEESLLDVMLAPLGQKAEISPHSTWTSFKDQRCTFSGEMCLMIGLTIVFAITVPKEIIDARHAKSLERIVLGCSMVEYHLNF